MKVIRALKNIPGVKNILGDKFIFTGQTCKPCQISYTLFTPFSLTQGYECSCCLGEGVGALQKYSFNRQKKSTHIKSLINHESCSYNLDSLSCLISMLSFWLFPPHTVFFNCRVWMQIKLNFEYCCLRQSVPRTGEKGALTSALLAGAVGIPACILC